MTKANVIYVIGRPIEGVTLNGNEYLMDKDNKILEFTDYNDCINHVVIHITDENPEDFIWEKDWEDS